MRPLLALACVAAAFTGLAFVAPEARACSPACWAPKFPAERQTIPAGTKHLPIHVQGSMTIADANGRVVFTGTPTKEGVAELDAPLTSGAYTVSHGKEGCGENEGRPFTVGAERAAPSVVGALVARPPQALEARPAGEGNSCLSADGAPARTSISIEFTPSTEMEPWVPLTYFAVTVDGQRIGKEGWGDTQGAHEQYPHGASYLVADITTLCGSAPATWSGGPSEVAAGKHRIELRARIAGTTTELPVASTEVDIQCSTTPATVTPITDPSDPTSGGNNGSSSSSGCSASPRGATPTFGALALLAMIGFAARRRRAAA